MHQKAEVNGSQRASTKDCYIIPNLGPKISLMSIGILLTNIKTKTWPEESVKTTQLVEIKMKRGVHGKRRTAAWLANNAHINETYKTIK